MDVRLATAADLADLRFCFEALVRESLEHYPAPYPRVEEDQFDTWTLAIFRHLQGNPDFGAFVATDDLGKVIGFVAVEVCERLVGAPTRYAVGHWLWVHPALRSVGVGKALILAVCAWCQARGLDTIECDERAGDQQWERRGFTTVTTRVAMAVSGVRAYATAPPRPPAPVAVEASIATPKKKRRVRKKKVGGAEARPNGAPEP